MKEKVVNFGEDKSLIGILSDPEDKNKNLDFCIVFINAGFIHKIGPNRLYVKLARNLAEKGFCSFRFDYSGMGDSRFSNQDQSPEKIKLLEIKQAIDVVQEYTGINKVLLIGMCSGAEDSFNASFKDERVIGLSLIDGIYISGKLLNNIYQVAIRKNTIRYYKKNIFSLKRWLKILTGRSNLFRKKNFIFVFNVILSLIVRFFKVKRKEVEITDRTDKSNMEEEYAIKDWIKLLNRDAMIYLIFCEGGVAYDIFNHTIANHFNKSQLNNKIKIELIKNVDHTFTPIWTQQCLIDKIGDWIMKNFK